MILWLVPIRNFSALLKRKIPCKQLGVSSDDFALHQEISVTRYQVYYPSFVTFFAPFKLLPSTKTKNDPFWERPHLSHLLHKVTTFQIDELALLACEQSATRALWTHLSLRLSTLGNHTSTTVKIAVPRHRRHACDFRKHYPFERFSWDPSKRLLHWCPQRKIATAPLDRAIEQLPQSS